MTKLNSPNEEHTPNNGKVSPGETPARSASADGKDAPANGEKPRRSRRKTRTPANGKASPRPTKKASPPREKAAPKTRKARSPKGEATPPKEKVTPSNGKATPPKEKAEPPKEKVTRAKRKATPSNGKATPPKEGNPAGDVTITRVDIDLDGSAPKKAARPVAPRQPKKLRARCALLSDVLDGQVTTEDAQSADAAKAMVGDVLSLTPVFMESTLGRSVRDAVIETVAQDQPTLGRNQLFQKIRALHREAARLPVPSCAKFCGHFKPEVLETRCGKCPKRKNDLTQTHPWDGPPAPRLLEMPLGEEAVVQFALTPPTWATEKYRAGAHGFFRLEEGEMDDPETLEKVRVLVPFRVTSKPILNMECVEITGSDSEKRGSKLRVTVMRYPERYEKALRAGKPYDEALKAGSELTDYIAIEKLHAPNTAHKELGKLHILANGGRGLGEIADLVKEVTAQAARDKSVKRTPYHTGWHSEFEGFDVRAQGLSGLPFDQYASFHLRSQSLSVDASTSRSVQIARLGASGLVTLTLPGLSAQSEPDARHPKANVCAVEPGLPGDEQRILDGITAFFEHGGFPRWYALLHGMAAPLLALSAGIMENATLMHLWSAGSAHSKTTESRLVARFQGDPEISEVMRTTYAAFNNAMTNATDAVLVITEANGDNEQRVRGAHQVSSAEIRQIAFDAAEGKSVRRANQDTTDRESPPLRFCLLSVSNSPIDSRDFKNADAFEQRMTTFELTEQMPHDERIAALAGVKGHGQVLRALLEVIVPGQKALAEHLIATRNVLTERIRGTLGSEIAQKLRYKISDAARVLTIAEVARIALPQGTIPLSFGEIAKAVVAHLVREGTAETAVGHTYDIRKTFEGYLEYSLRECRIVAVYPHMPQLGGTRDGVSALLAEPTYYHMPPANRAPSVIKPNLDIDTSLEQRPGVCICRATGRVLVAAAPLDRFLKGSEKLKLRHWLRHAPKQEDAQGDNHWVLRAGPDGEYDARRAMGMVKNGKGDVVRHRVNAIEFTVPKSYIDDTWPKTGENAWPQGFKGGPSKNPLDFAPASSLSSKRPANEPNGPQHGEPQHGEPQHGKPRSSDTDAPESSE